MPRPLLVSLIALPLTAACVAPLPRQEPIPQAMRVRLSGAEGKHDGTLIALGGDTLIMYCRRLGARIYLSASLITQLEIYRAQRGSAGEAVKGAGIGGLAGAGFGALARLGGAAIADALFPWAEPDYGRAAAEGAADGAATGILIGGAHGATAGKAVWEEITIHQLREELCHCVIPVPQPQLPEGRTSD